MFAARRSSSIIAAILLVGLVALGCGAEDVATQSGQRQAVAQTMPPTVVQPEPLHTPTLMPSQSTATATPLVNPALASAPAETAAPEATQHVSLHDCSGSTFVSIRGFGSLAELAWISERIVAGTVVERAEPVWGPERHPFEPGRRYIVTPYVVQIDANVRCVAATTVVVGQFGGTLGDCTQTFMPQTPLQVGDRVLLFLAREEAVPTLRGETVYFSVSMSFGQWPLDGDVVVRTPGGPFVEFEGRPVEHAVDAVLAALTSPPPSSPYMEEFVPLDVAPIGTRPPASP